MADSFVFVQDTLSHHMLGIDIGQVTGKFPQEGDNKSFSGEICQMTYVRCHLACSFVFVDSPCRKFPNTC